MPSVCAMDAQFALRFAEEWQAAWNSYPPAGGRGAPERRGPEVAMGYFGVPEEPISRRVSAVERGS
jgi:hypothetical protein